VTNPVPPLLASLLLSATTTAACGGMVASGDPGSAVDGSASGVTGPNEMGSVRVRVAVAGGANVLVLDWTLSNGSHSYSGTIQTNNSQVVIFDVGRVWAGTGYELVLSAADSNGDSCVGTSARFNVAAGATGKVSAPLVCGPPQARPVSAD
jgi:hypothetical protein